MSIEGPAASAFAAEGPATRRTGGHTDCAALRTAARALESAFLEEMLKQAGLGEMSGTFSGGVGEAQFASFLRHEQADAMTDAGGIGLAENIFGHLAGRTDCDG